MHPSAINLQRFSQPVLDCALVFLRAHVDEIDHDQAAHVTQAELPGDFLGRLQIRVEGRLFNVGAFGGARAVDIDGNQGFCRVDYQAAAGGQSHVALEGGLDLALDLVAVKQRDVVVVELHLAGVVRHHLGDKAAGFVEGFLRVNQNLANVLAQVVANGAQHDIVFLVKQGRGGLFVRCLTNGFPKLQQVVQIPLELLGTTPHASCADNNAHALGNVQVAHRSAQLVAIFALNASADAAGARIVGHQHHVPSGQADECGQRGALGATLFLVDLDHDLRALGDQLLDVQPGHFGGLFAEVLARYFL